MSSFWGTVVYKKMIVKVSPLCQYGLHMQRLGSFYYTTTNSNSLMVSFNAVFNSKLDRLSPESYVVYGTISYRLWR